MNGLEAKYTAKHLAKMIKRNRAMEKKVRRKSEINGYNGYENFLVAQHVAKENRKMSQEFRAFMIHNAFNKGRDFTTAEVQYLNLGENALADLRVNLAEYSQYMARFKNQQKAIQIVKHQLLNSDQIPQFEEWVGNSGE